MMAVHWIDHFVVGTNDLIQWVRWAERVLGMEIREISGVTTAARQQRRPIFAFGYPGVGDCHIGAFLQNEMLPPSPGLGRGLPRYGFHVRPEDIDHHLRRLDAHGLPHGDPTPTSAEGERGTAILFEDPDGNQYELWAPARMPDGAMDGCGPLGVGRISAAVLESRDLARTTDFLTSFWDVAPIQSADIPGDTRVFPLGAGGRLVYRRVEELQTRTRGFTRRSGMHTALTVPADAFFATYKLLWDALPEWDFDSRSETKAQMDAAALPARTALHGSQAGRQWKEMYGRGDDFYDWDTNCYHFVGGAPIDGSMATYRGRYMDDYVAEATKTPGARPIM